MVARPLASFGLALLAGCASAGDEYPSLAIRDAERISGTLDAPAAEPYVPPAPSAEVIDRVDRLVESGAAAHQAFLAVVPQARATISAARGAEVGSESWSRAEVALAEVQSAHGQTLVPLADLDRLFVDAATEGLAVERIAAAREQVAALAESERATVNELAAALP